MHFEAHIRRRRQICYKSLGEVLVALGKKSGLIMCQSRSLLFYGIHLPSLFLGGEFVKFFSRLDFLEKLLSVEYSYFFFDICYEF